MHDFLLTNPAVRAFAVIKDIYWDDQNAPRNDIYCQRVEFLANSLDAAAQGWPDSPMTQQLLMAAGLRFDAGHACINGDIEAMAYGLDASNAVLAEFQEEAHRVLHTTD